MADIFETVMLLLSGVAGVLCGVALGATLDQEPGSEATYTIANYWRRRSPAPADPAVPRVPRENIIPISKGRKQRDIVPEIPVVAAPAVSENE